jgi:hypothetical protein
LQYATPVHYRYCDLIPIGSAFCQSALRRLQRRLGRQQPNDIGALLGLSEFIRTKQHERRSDEQGEQLPALPAWFHFSASRLRLMPIIYAIDTNLLRKEGA